MKRHRLVKQLDLKKKKKKKNYQNKHFKQKIDYQTCNYNIIHTGIEKVLPFGDKVDIIFYVQQILYHMVIFIPSRPSLLYSELISNAAEH